MKLFYQIRQAVPPIILTALGCLLIVRVALAADSEKSVHYDFKESIPSSWTVVAGSWEAGEGVLRQIQDGGRLRLLTDQEFIEGTLDVDVTLVGGPSFGFFGQYTGSEETLHTRHGPYGYIAVEVPDQKSSPFGGYAIGTSRTMYHTRFSIKLIVSEKSISYIVGNSVVAVIKNTRPGKLVRVGLYAETPVEFRNLKITRVK